MKVGILAVQGAFEAHARALDRIGVAHVLVRSASELATCDGLVLPGGESSVQLELIERLGLDAPLRAFLASGAPVLATCAGLVLLASRVASPAQRAYGAIDVAVERNAWGRQVESFEAPSDRGRPLVFIRAPRIVAVGEGVTVLDTLRGEPVLVRQGRRFGATFHPELAGDDTLHAEVFGDVAAAA